MEEDHTCQIFHFDLFGTQEEKYDFLRNNTLDSVPWTELHPEEPYNFFVPKDFSQQEEYEKEFKIDELMQVYVSGIKTQRDDASIFVTEAEMKSMKDDFIKLSVDELKHKHGFKDVRDWQVELAKDDIQKNPVLTDKLCYRPFDIRWMLYTGHTKGIQGYPRLDAMRHLIGEDNFSMIVARQCVGDWRFVFVTDKICDINYIASAGKLGGGYFFPLYLYSEDGKERVPNLNKEILDRIVGICVPQMHDDKQPDKPSICGQCICEDADAYNENVSNDVINTFFDKNDTSHLSWSRKLPHWHQDNKYAFVTFRLNDSLPQSILDDYRDEKEKWLKQHPKPWDEKTAKEYYDRFSKSIDLWLDRNYGACLLGNVSNRKMVEKALHFYDGKHYTLLSYVVMPNHVHLLVQLYQGHELASVIKSIKSFTAKQINENEKTTGKVWQSESYDRLIRDETHYKNVVRYIYANNPKLAWCVGMGDSSDVASAGTQMPTITMDTVASASAGTQMPTMMLPTMVFDYVYAVLHSPSYRKKYKEFLKIDFPRVPYPASAAEFERLAGIGGRLRRLHLMQEVPATRYAQFNTPGTCVVDGLRWEPQPVVGNASERCHDGSEQRSEALPTLGSVWINDVQRFENVPEAAWTFYIGGYQPAQKWLKDRRGRTLTYDDVAHYQRIIAVLSETDRLMKEIDISNQI